MPPPAKASTKQVQANLKAGREEVEGGGKRSHPPHFEKAPIFGQGSRVLHAALHDADNVSGPPPKPSSGPMAVATQPEWNIYWALTIRLGLRDGIDFVYRKTAGLLATLSERTQLDFMMLDGTQIAIEVQGIYWHYQQGRNKMADDLVRMSELAGKWNIVNIDEDDALRNPEYFTREALKGVDHSYRYKGFFFKPGVTLN